MDHQTISLRVFIDRSGSMENWHQPVTAGINELLSAVTSFRGGERTELTIATFDSLGIDVLRRGFSTWLEPLEPREISPRALSNINDAVAAGLTENVVETEDSLNGLIVFTDGRDVASSRTAEAVREIVHRKRISRWVVILVGANIDVMKTAESLGIAPEYAIATHVQGQRVLSVPTLIGRFLGRTQNPIAAAFKAAVTLFYAHESNPQDILYRRPEIGFTDAERNAAMAVTGNGISWSEAADVDMVRFREPFPDVFKLSRELQRAQTSLPPSFKIARGSYVGVDVQTGGLHIPHSMYCVIESDDQLVATEAARKAG